MQRPIQHIIETRSRKAFEDLVPDEWVCRPLSPDYGIDYVIEIFKNGLSTGKSFNVQLKGTDQKTIDDKVRVKVKVATLEYFGKQPLPTMFVVYSTKTERFWAIWINNLLKTRKIAENQKTMQISLNKSHIIEGSFFKELADTFCLTIPKKINITASSNHEIGDKYHTILKRWLKHFFNDLFVFDDDHYPAKVLFGYSYKGDYLKINLDYNILGSYELDDIFLTESSDLLLYPAPDFSALPIELREPFFLIANLFLENSPEASMKIYKMIFCEYSGNFKNPLSIWNLGRIAIEKGFIADFQQLLKQCLDKELYHEYEYLNLAYALYSPQERRLEYFGDNIKNFISKIEDDDSKGMQYYNLANYNLRSNPRIAIRYYIKATRLRPWYAEAGFYWWYELGTAFYSQKRFKCAEKCYLNVIALTDEEKPLIFAQIGDCLFYQGKFSEAKEWIDKYFDEVEAGQGLSYICLTHVVIELLIANKLDNISRNPEKAIQLIKKAEIEKNSNTAAGVFDEAIRCDPLCAEAWFKLGLLYHNIGNKTGSFYHFLVSCIIDKKDSFAWLNTMFLSSSLGEDNLHLSFHIADAILGEFGTSIFDDIKDILKENESLTDKERQNQYEMLLMFFKAVDKDHRGKDITSELSKLMDLREKSVKS